jgi:hypothetical protein
MAGGLFTIVLIVVIPILDRMHLVEILKDQNVAHTCSLATISRNIARSMYFIQIGLPLTPPMQRIRMRVLLTQTLYGMQNMTPRHLVGLFPATALYSALFKIKDRKHPPLIIGIGAESICGLTNGKSLQRSVTTKSALNSMHSFYIIIIPLTQTFSNYGLYRFSEMSAIMTNECYYDK